MTKEAIPIMRAEMEAIREYPKGGEKRDSAVKARIKTIKARGVEEKKRGSLRYRDNMFWAGITSQEDFDEKCLEAAQDYKKGGFFLERIGRYREVDAQLTLTLLHLRTQWVEEYEVKTVPEFMLLDMALVSYFHFIRLNEALDNIMASIEWDVFAQDAPRFKGKPYRDPLMADKSDQAVAEELAHRLSEVLQPTLEQYNRMFIRNLKALRDLRRGNIQLNIGNVGQVNIGEKQINVEGN
jgi:hypothetical protein